MAKKKSVQLGDPVIRTRAKVVRDFKSVVVKRTIRDLVDSMRANNLVGMAAPQIGVGLRIFVSEIRTTTYRKNIDAPDEVRVFINPRILLRSRASADGYEGCGSVAMAQLFGTVRRPTSVTVRAQHPDGSTFTLTTDDLLARVIQHEVDHLDGIVFLDRITDSRSLVDRDTYIALGKRRKRA